MTATDDLKQMFDEAVTRINVPSFAMSDPVQFPRRFKNLPDIEIASLLCSTIAWGNRKMICNNCDRLLHVMHDTPLEYTMSGDYEALDDAMNLHRTFFARDLKYMLRGLRDIYSHYPTLNDFAADHKVGDSAAPAWQLASLLQQQWHKANGTGNPRCLPSRIECTALKRLNMALRWLVRNDGIVDMGVWNAIKPSQLYIPLDVHVADTARTLSLITRRSNDRKTVEELTAVLRQMCPEDPVKYDYALFGIGMGL